MKLVIDGNNRFVSSYCVSPAKGVDGVSVGGIVGFIKSLQSIINYAKPTDVYIVWDGIDGSRRKKQINNQYKANRKTLTTNRVNPLEKTPDEQEQNKLWQMQTLKSILKCLPIFQLEIAYMEADDIIAILCNEFLQEEKKVIVTTDKDFIQLLDDNTLLYRPVNNELLNKHDILEKFGIRPDNFALARAIDGDVSDNLKGVYGISLKTIVKMFPIFAQEKISLTKILEICEQVENKENNKFKKIVENKQLIEDNLHLMRLDAVKISLQNRKELQEVVDGKRNLSFSQQNFIQHLTKLEIVSIISELNTLFQFCKRWKFENHEA